MKVKLKLRINKMQINVCVPDGNYCDDATKGKCLFLTINTSENPYCNLLGCELEVMMDNEKDQVFLAKLNDCPTKTHKKYFGF